MNKFVLDTMAVILWFEKRKLPQFIKELLSDSGRKQNEFIIPAMVLAEIGYLKEKRRIDISLSIIRLKTPPKF